MTAQHGLDRTRPEDFSQITVGENRGRNVRQFPGPSCDQQAPVCEENPYPLYEPGIYEAQCVRARIYRDPQFRAWKAMLEFRLIQSGGSVWGFLHLGVGEKPYAGRRSRYRRAWVIANGEQPRRRQVLSERVFKRKIFEVEIGTVEQSFDQRPHPVAARYSTVCEILSRRWP